MQIETYCSVTEAITAEMVDTVLIPSWGNKIFSIGIHYFICLKFRVKHEQSEASFGYDTFTRCMAVSSPRQVDK